VSAAPPAVRAEGLTRRFGDFTAVDRVSFEVGQGEIFGYLGANGAGKSTTIRMLIGLLVPSAGEASVAGHDVASAPDRVKASIGYMSQRFSLYLDLPVEENLLFFGAAYGLAGRALRRRAGELLERVGLDAQHDATTGDLPGGQRQRLALACALLHQPGIVFLDEPTAGVDPVARRMLWDLLFHLAEEGTTLFVTTHYMDEAERCTQAAYIYYGKLLVSGDPNSMKRDEIATTNRRLEIVCQPLMPALGVLRDAPFVDDVSVFGQALHIRVKGLPPEPASPDGFASFAASAQRAVVMDVLRKHLLAAGIEVRAVRSVYPSLEDIFVSFTRRMDRQAGR